MTATPTAVVVMGVSGSGKTTVAHQLARRLGWEFAEGDDHHPAANVEKMRAGIPLDDADREPWLRTLAAWIAERERAGTSCVLTCSALKRSYRDLLRQGNDAVFFAHVDVPEQVLLERVTAPHRALHAAVPADQPAGHPRTARRRRTGHHRPGDRGSRRRGRRGSRRPPDELIIVCVHATRPDTPAGRALRR